MTIEEHVPLSSLTTFRIGGKARFFCRAESLADLHTAVAFAKKERLPILALGGGSNVLISDAGFPGLVIQINLLGIEFSEKKGTVEVKVGAGESWDDLVQLCVDKGLWGLENLSGIPGTVGGAPVQNIGAYGVELKELLVSVEVFDPKTSAIRTVSKRDCRLGYRDSIFKNEAKHLIIAKVTLSLSRVAHPRLSYKDVAAHFSKNNRPSLSEIRAAILEIRSRKFPDLETTGTAGSFFKNPIVSTAVYKKLKKEHPELPAFAEGKGHYKLSLAWIIDHVCKLKNLRVGDASVSPKQALVICTAGTATAQDVETLAEKIATAVHRSVGIVIEPEVRMIR